MQIILNGDPGELHIRVVRREHPESKDKWDGNWLESEVRVKTSGFTAQHPVNLRSDELESFSRDLDRTITNLAGVAELHSMENQLRVQLEPQKRGAFTCSGECSWDHRNKLPFEFEADFSSVENLSKQLHSLLEAYPEIK